MQLRPLTTLDLKRLRGLVFGHRGRRFDEAVIQDFLLTRPWYKPDPHYKVASLNAVERTNMDLIKEAEWKRHAHAEPGDMRFYQTNVLTKKELGPHSALEWQIMAGEIEAWYGKRFDDQPWLQAYYVERYWYHSRADYSPRRLTSAERTNLGAITKAEKFQRRLALAPGDMALSQESAISTGMLRGLSLYELRLLRNEIYARHGARFRTSWLQDYFDGQPWYRPRLALTAQVALSPFEKRNAQLIQRAEETSHWQLATESLSPALLQGLLADDASKLRNEIYDRHGKVFHDRWLQNYFRSLSWYRPDPKFRDRLLSSTERDYAARIQTYEERGRSRLMKSAA